MAIRSAIAGTVPSAPSLGPDTAQGVASWPQGQEVALAAFGQCALRIGQSGFHDSLLDAVGRLFAHELRCMTRYSRFSAPDFLVRGDYGSDFIEFYEARLYSYDPFYRYWQETERPGVVTLSRLATTEVGRIRYANIVLAEMGITDELGLFLPPVGRSSVALFFDRCSGRFSDADMALADALYPLISGLHQAHVNSVLGVASGMDAEAAISSAKPTRILDRERHEVFRNAAWRRLAEDKAEDLARALAGLNAGAGSQAPFGSRLILHRAALPESFGLAPGGWIDTIEQVGQAPAAPGHPALPPDMARLLTRREQDIVEMILQGYPTTLIAGRLGLSRGTVKNHRQRIYQKLDITTEREIFLSFIAATTSS